MQTMFELHKQTIQVKLWKRKVFFSLYFIKKSNINNLTDEKKYEAYAEAKGYEDWGIGTWADGLEEFYDADGQTHKVSDATITNFLIEQEIQKKLGTSNEDIVKNTVNYENSNNALEQELAAYAMSGGDFSSLAGQFNQDT